MKKTIVFVLLFIGLIVYVFILPDPNRFSSLKGQYVIYKFLYKNKPNKNFDDKTLLIDHLSNRINIGDVYETAPENKILIGKYQFEKSDDGNVFLIITNSKDNFINGRYRIKIDTLEYNDQYNNFKITFSSELVKIICFKSMKDLNF